MNATERKEWKLKNIDINSIDNIKTQESQKVDKQLIKDDFPELVGPMIDILNPSLIFSEFSPLSIISLILSFKVCLLAS